MSTTHNTTETKQQIKALSELLDIEEEDIEPSQYDNQIFDVGDDQYLVCRDEDAKARAADYIKESLWCFNASFLLPHTILPCDAEYVITAIVDAKYEDANDTLEALIPDMDALIEDAIDSDGRGHFLNHYDGEEYESQGYFIYQR